MSCALGSGMKLPAKKVCLGFSQTVPAETNFTPMLKNTGNEGKCECMVEVRYREVLLLTYESKLDAAKDLLRKEGLFHPKTDLFGREKDIMNEVFLNFMMARACISGIGDI